MHFEDLDPKRFEDLVRQLIYDFKDWQSIEATGRGGADDGFDIRAFEKVYTVDNDDETAEERPQPMEGNSWMIQCKREKEASPAKIKKIIGDNIQPENPAYGYILAVSSNISKKTYDVFREEVRAKGVMEFYIWGKSELEDLLYQPKNDRILFTFFGISLVSRRHSRSTEVRTIVATKNKMMRILADEVNMSKSVLIRDLKDEHYPYSFQISDFKQHPRWQEYMAFAHHPKGTLFHVHEYHAYVNQQNKTYDFTDKADIIYRTKEDDEERKEALAKRKPVMFFWELLERKTQAYYHIEGIIKYQDMAVIDDKGDKAYEFPHIFVDYLGRSPFSGTRSIIKQGHLLIDLSEYKRIKIFPDIFPEPAFGEIYRDKAIILNNQTLKAIRNNPQELRTLYTTTFDYDYLKPKDVIPIRGEEAVDGEVKFVMVTYIRKQNTGNYLEEHENQWIARQEIEQQLGAMPDDNKQLTILELKAIYEWELEKGPQ